VSRNAYLFASLSDIRLRCEHPRRERATWPEKGWENLKPCAEESVVMSKKMRSDLQFIAPRRCAKNQPPSARSTPVGRP
jgi:hypothetical protein